LGTRLGTWIKSRGVQALHAFLQDFLTNNRIRSVVDLGCGDWQLSQHVDWGDCAYTGIDVVPSVIDTNHKRFGRHNRTFLCADPATDPSRVPTAELRLVKDVLQRLSNEYAQKILTLTNQSKSSPITNAYAPINDDYKNGDTRPLDIRELPFNIKHAALLWAYAEKAIFLVVNPDQPYP
jgi:SAM-dependent methyltransferase